MVVFALLLLYRTTNHAKGQAFSLYVMLYSVVRFFLEYLRGDYTQKVFGLLTSAQTTSVAATVLAAAAWVWFGLRAKAEGETPAAAENAPPLRREKKKKD